MAVKYPIGTRVKHKTITEYAYAGGTVVDYIIDKFEHRVIHRVQVDGGFEYFAYGEQLEEVYA